jgi:hypothetical protein
MTPQDRHDLYLVNLELAGWSIGAPGIGVGGSSIIDARHPKHGKIVGAGRSDSYALQALEEKIFNAEGLR